MEFLDKWKWFLAMSRLKSNANRKHFKLFFFVTHSIDFCFTLRSTEVQLSSLNKHGFSMTPSEITYFLVKNMTKSNTRKSLRFGLSRTTITESFAFDFVFLLSHFLVCSVLVQKINDTLNRHVNCYQILNNFQQEIKLKLEKEE